MRKITLIIVGLLMSIVASASTLDEITTDINGSTVNLGKLTFNKGCSSFSCDATDVISKKISGGLFLDYVIFDEKGNQTNKHPYLEHLKTASSKESSDVVVTIRPVVFNKGKHYPFYTQQLWEKVDTSSIDKKNIDSGGMAAANVSSSMTNSGFSNTASAGAGLALFFLSTNSPRADFIYFIKVAYKDKTEKSFFIKLNDTTTPYAIDVLINIIKDAR